MVIDFKTTRKTIWNRVACETPDALGWCVHCWAPQSWPTCQIAGRYGVFDGHPYFGWKVGYYTRSNSNCRSNIFQNHTQQRLCLRPSGRASWPSSMSDFKTTTTWSSISDGKHVASPCVLGISHWIGWLANTFPKKTCCWLISCTNFLKICWIVYNLWV